MLLPRNYIILISCLCLISVSLQQTITIVVSSTNEDIFSLHLESTADLDDTYVLKVDLSGTATNSDFKTDYQLPTGTLVFVFANTSTTTPINLINIDTTFEQDETFKLVQVSSTNSVLISNIGDFWTITNDDSLVVTVESTVLTADEDAVGTSRDRPLTVSFSADMEFATLKPSVQFTSGKLVNGSDYTTSIPSDILGPTTANTKYNIPFFHATPDIIPEPNEDGSFLVSFYIIWW